MSELSNIIQSLLEMSKILFLPNTYIVENKDKYKDYFSSIDSKTLLHLVKELKVGDSDTIKQIFGGPVIDNPMEIPNATNRLQQNLDVIKPDLNNITDYQYYNEFLQMNQNMEQLQGQIQSVKTEIDVANKQLSQFKCVEGLDNIEHEFISNFILDCSKYSIRDVKWYRVVLGLDTIDDGYNVAVEKRLSELNINFEHEVLAPYLQLLENDMNLKKIFEYRLIECSKSPYSFWDKLTGSISFDSLSDCNLCHNDCILYLNDSYKEFLMTETPGLDVTTKLKVLVYCEHRLFQFSKYITMEAIRLKGRKYTRVKNILTSLDKKSKNKVFMKKKAEQNNIENENKLKELNTKVNELRDKMGTLVNNRDMSGGANMEQQPMEQQPMEQQQPIVSNPTPVYKEVNPNCEFIVNDIRNGRIQQKNFMYLSSKCNSQIGDALK